MTHWRPTHPWFPLILVVAVIVLVGVSPSGADTELEAKLREVRTKVETAELEIQQMKDEFNELLGKRRKLEESIKKLKQEDQALQIRVADLKQRMILATAEVDRSRERVVEHQRKIQQRLKAAYVYSAMSVRTSMATHHLDGDRERLSVYMRKVRDYDAALFAAASEAAQELERGKTVLEETLDAQESFRRQLDLKRKTVEDDGKKLKAVIQQLVEKQRQAQEALALLTSEAKKVEDMIASLTSGEDEDGREDEHAEKDGTSPSGLRSKEKSIDERPTVQKTILYPSLFDSKFKVSAPVHGEVLQGFGRSKLTNFVDMVRSKGLEFSTPPGGDVYAVSEGKVVFTGSLPGYEQVVIIEHGARSFSLYGRLGSVLVKTGDSVEQEQKIATTSSPDEKGRNFYFEVRKHGLAVNPETVLTAVSR